MQSKKLIQFIHGIEEQHLLIHVQPLQCSRKSFLFGTLSHFFYFCSLGSLCSFSTTEYNQRWKFQSNQQRSLWGVSYLIMAWIYGCKLGLSFSYSKSPHSNHYSISSHSHTIADKLHVSPQLVLRRTVGTVAANLYQTHHWR